jgi:hypothetical protein
VDWGLIAVEVQEDESVLVAGFEGRKVAAVVESIHLLATWMW